MRGLTRADWAQAARLALVGNLLYYLCLAAAIQRAGGPLVAMVIGALPVVIAIASNLRGGAARQRDGRLQWRRLVPSLLLIGAGIACVNHAELQSLRAVESINVWRYASGVLLALAAAACWTWYPIRNADWLRAHADRPAGTWATAQGVATLPLAAAGMLGWCVWRAWFDPMRAPVAGAGTGVAPGIAPGLAPGGSDNWGLWLLGPTPGRFIALMLLLGVLASWLGTLCWNAASQRLPPLLAGQLIVFETLAALAYAFALRGQWPAPVALAGIALLLAGVVWGVRQRPT